MMQNHEQRLNQIKQDKSPSTKHCRLHCRMRSVQNNLTNIIHRLKSQSSNNHIRHKSPRVQFLNNNQQSLKPMPLQSLQRPVASEYFKVTETAGNIIGVQQFKIKRHYTDDSEMKTALQWDNLQQTARLRKQYDSKVIKLSHDRKTYQLQKMREKSEIKPWQKDVRMIVKYEDSSLDYQTSPKFNNAYLQQKTKDNNKYENQREENIKRSDKWQNKNLNKRQRREEQYERGDNIKNSRNHQRRNQKSGQYTYTKRVITRTRDERNMDSQNSTDSEFSGFNF